jgi:hypothetical protein
VVPAFRARIGSSRLSIRTAALSAQLTRGNIELRQNIQPTPTDLITQLSYWIRIPDGIPTVVSIGLYYSDGTFDQPVLVNGVLQETTNANWTFFNWTSDLAPNKELIAVSVFGFDRVPTLTDETFLDDFTLTEIPEPSLMVFLAVVFGYVVLLVAKRRAPIRGVLTASSPVDC